MRLTKIKLKSGIVIAGTILHRQDFGELPYITMAHKVSFVMKNRQGDEIQTDGIILARIYDQTISSEECIKDKELSDYLSNLQNRIKSHPPYTDMRYYGCGELDAVKKYFKSI